jgi:hypothetical protein
VFEFPFGRIVDTGMACRRGGIIPQNNGNVPEHGGGDGGDGSM